jgi:RNA polymerase sigma-70 factor (ECF subfamily)
MYDHRGDASGRARLESEVAALCAQGDFAGAATAAIEGYGPELYGFILSLVRDEGDGADVFSRVCERVWRGLPRFEGRASLRTWAYRVARHEVVSHQRSEGRRRRRQVSDSQVLAGVPLKPRTATVSFLRSQTRNRLAELRATLPLEDQTLLILRVDRGLDWNEIATVFHDGTLDDALRVRESARLRKRFQSVKERLRELAVQEGLLEPR